jgi:hypothetical protein
MRWVGYVARLGEKRTVYRLWQGNLKTGDQLEDLGVEGRVILNWILNRMRGVD